MEQHPVPQDIKSFQFKLIGDMTLRQFAFLAGGLVIAYLGFVLPLHPLIKWPVILLSSSFGIGCAFFPINERPLDQWVVAFFKAVFGPTQRVWKKGEEPPAYLQIAPVPKKTSPPPPITEDREKLKKYLASLPKKTEETLADEEKKFLKKIQPILAPGEETVLPKADEEKTQKPSLAAGEIPLAKPVLKVTDLITAAPKHIPSLSGARVRKLGKPRAVKLPKVVPIEIPVTPMPKPPPPPKEIFTKTREVTEMAKEEVAKAKKLEGYQREIERLRAEKERLLKEAKLRREEARRAREAIAKMASKRPFKTPPEEKPTPPTKPLEKPVPTTGPIKKLVLPRITDRANIINGVVADRAGNILEGVIIVIKDQDGMPVRALKTNPLGQFATATPLPNGVYTIEAEKEGYEFDIIYQEIKGEVLPPLEIRAR